MRERSFEMPLRVDESKIYDIGSRERILNERARH